MFMDVCIKIKHVTAFTILSIYSLYNVLPTKRIPLNNALLKRACYLKSCYGCCKNTSLIFKLPLTEAVFFF